jgi:hypothetical protein
VKTKTETRSKATMWLIDVGSLKLRFFSAPPEEYVILSHTWGDDEVLFQDMKADDAASLAAARGKKGWDKIQYTCDQARKNRYQYAWIDTCCIDKSSSAELSEAINSMFRWYSEASCCYAYLEDYEIPRGAGRAACGSSGGVEFEVTRERLARCRWFTRGWTLQELIAPRNMVFYGRGWSQLGTKETLQQMLSEITGVDEEVLDVMEYMYNLPAGRRMSWAARRQTAREEDMAYCLMGLFGINMPLLYGEGGDRAFVRLQEEVIRRHNDVSLFAWRQEEPRPLYRGLLANAPSEFAHCAHLVARTTTDGFFSGSRLIMTDEGLAITQRSLSREDEERKKISVLLQRDMTEIHGLELSHVFDFSAERDGRRGCKRIGIRLQKFGDAYVRVRPEILESPSRFTKNLEPSGSATELQYAAMARPASHVKTTLSPERSTFIELMLQRKIFLLYRRKLVRNLLEMNCDPPKPTSLSSLGASAKDILELNRITAVHCPVIAREYDLGVGGDPIWWDNLVVVVGDGDNGLRVRLSVVCGIPAMPDAPSESILPWFAIFTDRRSSSSGGRRASSSASNHEGTMDGGALVSYLHGLPPRETVDRETQRYVSDIIFEQYADSLGNLVQERMPTVVMLRDRAKKVYEIRINRLGSNAASTFAADVQYIAR